MGEHVLLQIYCTIVRVVQRVTPVCSQVDDLATRTIM